MIAQGTLTPAFSLETSFALRRQKEHLSVRACFWSSSTFRCPSTKILNDRIAQLLPSKVVLLLVTGPSLEAFRNALDDQDCPGHRETILDGEKVELRDVADRGIDDELP